MNFLPQTSTELLQ